MVKKQGILLIALLFSVFVEANIKFSTYFKNDVLRFDIVLSGDNTTQQASIKQLYSEKEWGGRQSNLNTFHGKGTYKFELYDASSNQLIYTDGFCTLFQEWQTTHEADVMQRAFENSLYAPMPKKDIRVVLIHRTDGAFTDTLLNVDIDVKGELIRPTEKADAKVKDILVNGSEEKCIDIVVIGEGYVKGEESLFFRDAENFAEGLFTSLPFNENKQRFNIRAVMPFSEEEGADIPPQNIFVKTALDASYNTLYSDRYLMTGSVFKLSNYVAMVPHDQVIILVNSEKYGGGGIYNFYSISSARGRSNLQVFIHELGHSFAGLADEYYTSEVSYNDFYPKHIEPWEPNITTLVDFDHKWKSMIESGVPIPTPVKNKFKSKVGVYEGGGYVAKGVYRPYQDCRMKTNEAEDFCPVCARAVKETILFYTGE